VLLITLQALQSKKFALFPSLSLGEHTVNDGSNNLMDLSFPLSFSAGKSSSIEMKRGEGARKGLSCGCSGDDSADSSSGSKSSNSAARGRDQSIEY